MNKAIFLAVLMLFGISSIYAQKKEEKPKEKKNVIEKVDQFGKDLIAQKDQVDTNANKFVQDNLSIVIPAVWKEKGTQLFNDLKLAKIDEDPLNATFPFPDKKIVKGLTVTLNTIKKSAVDKKQMVLNQVRTHLIAVYKEAAKSTTPTEMNNQINSMVTGPEAFTTAQGNKGELYLIHDIQSQQSNYIVLLLMPTADPNKVQFVQFQYFKFIYDTTYPEDIMEWKTFVYPDEQQEFIDFTKKIMKTLVIK